MKSYNLFDKEFEILIPAVKIQSRIDELARQINQDYKGKKPIFLGILNGSFMFAADLFKKITIEAQISFMKLASYEGTGSTGKVKQLIGLNSSVENQHIIILEDIVDTGLTLKDILNQIEGHQPASVKTASLLFKPDACKIDVPVDYTGFEIPNKFVLGYGLDYDGFGRNTQDIFVLKD